MGDVQSGNGSINLPPEIDTAGDGGAGRGDVAVDADKTVDLAGIFIEAQCDSGLPQARRVIPRFVMHDIATCRQYKAGARPMTSAARSGAARQSSTCAAAPRLWRWNHSMPAVVSP